MHIDSLIVIGINFFFDFDLDFVYLILNPLEMVILLSLYPYLDPFLFLLVFLLPLVYLLYLRHLLSSLFLPSYHLQLEPDLDLYLALHLFSVHLSLFIFPFILRFSFPFLVLALLVWRHLQVLLHLLPLIDHQV